MFRQKKIHSIIPLVFIFIVIFIVSPHKLVHLKSHFLSLIKIPLNFSMRTYFTFLNANRIFTIYADFKENEKELKNLKFQLNNFNELKLENERLRKLLELKQNFEFAFQPAQVIGKEPTNWLDSLIINKGTNHNIFINQPIMDASGLIGKIIEVGNDWAKVLLISDLNSRVVVLVQRTREEGMLEGIGRGMCRLKYLPLDADVKLNDIVISAGVGGVYPKGLLVGRVESIRLQRGGIYKSCIIKPAVKLSQVEEVLCLKSDLNQ
ncbi:MAG: rod shape-determining protein MreC [Candidatus Omnitrophota bacterium]